MSKGQSIPASHLVQLGDERLASILARPLMYGGTWMGVEIAILDALELREIGLFYPSRHSVSLAGRWNKACNEVLPETRNGSLAGGIIREYPDRITGLYESWFGKAVQAFLLSNRGPKDVDKPI